MIKFWWNGKKDKIKRSVIINEYEEGGLKCHIFKLFTKPLKCHKLLDPFNHSPRKIILLGYIQKWGGSNILYLNKEGLEKIAEKLTRFGKMFFELIRVETGKGGVGGYPTRLEPIWLKPLIK